MSFPLDFLFLRRPPINYVCPPVCEVIFSSTGVQIVLEPFPVKNAPTGVRLSNRGILRLLWNNYPGALCYTIYRAIDPNDPFGPYEVVAECINTQCDGEPCFDIPTDGCYRVSAITLEGESALSDPFCTCCITVSQDITVTVN